MRNVQGAKRVGLERWSMLCCAVLCCVVLCCQSAIAFIALSPQRCYLPQPPVAPATRTFFAGSVPSAACTTAVATSTAAAIASVASEPSARATTRRARGTGAAQKLLALHGRHETAGARQPALQPALRWCGVHARPYPSSLLAETSGCCWPCCVVVKYAFGKVRCQSDVSRYWRSAGSVYDFNELLLLLHTWISKSLLADAHNLQSVLQLSAIAVTIPHTTTRFVSRSRKVTESIVCLTFQLPSKTR